MEKFHKKVWGKELGRKKKYYIKDFNTMCGIQQKEFIGASNFVEGKVPYCSIKDQLSSTSV